MEAIETAIRTCAELTAGDEIEAWHNGKLFHRGRVTRTIPLMGLFWIVDARHGARKLIDVEALEIVRCEPAAGSGAAAPDAAVPGLPQPA